MRGLYRLLLALYPKSVRDRFAAEMVQVFEDASEDARTRGGSAYVRFCLRETTGLLTGLVTEGRMMKHRRMILLGAIGGLVIAVTVASDLTTRPYTSTAVLRANPPMIPERFVIGQPGVEVGRVVPTLMQTVTSRGTLTNIIRNYGLFPVEQQKMPMEDVVDRMRQAITMSAADMGAMRISFSYPDRVLAQKVTADLVSRVITEYIRTRTTQSVLTSQFMKDRTEKAAVEWQQSLNAIREAEATGKNLARARLDAEIARQRYESFSAKLAEAETSAEMERRQQGQTLELLDPASLPSPRLFPPEEKGIRVLLVALYGAITGALLGWLMSTVLTRRATRAVAEAH